MLTTDSANALYEAARIESDRLYALLPEWQWEETEDLWVRRLLLAGLGETFLAWKREMYQRRVLIKLLVVIKNVEAGHA